jgi:hypothetical protein
MKATVPMEPSEVFKFALAVGLAPLVFTLARRLRLSSARWPFLVMYVAIASGYLMTVLGAVLAPGLFNLLEHAFSAVGAIAFALAARAFRRDVARMREGAA